MAKGQNESLTGEVSPINDSNKTIIWSTDNSSVASVDSNGNILALNKKNAY